MRGRVGAHPYHRGHRTMTVEDIKRALGVLELRERLIFKLGVFAGLRPGEIFGLRRSRLSVDTAHIQEQIYRGKLDTPKTQKSVRMVALSAIVREDLENWQCHRMAWRVGFSLLKS